MDIEGRSISKRSNKARGKDGRFVAAYDPKRTVVLGHLDRISKDAPCAVSELLYISMLSGTLHAREHIHSLSSPHKRFGCSINNIVPVSPA